MSELFFAPSVPTNTKARKTNTPELKVIGGSDHASGHMKLNEAATEAVKCGHGEYAIVMDNSKAIAAAVKAGEIEEGEVATTYFVTPGWVRDNGEQTGFKLAASSKAKVGDRDIIVQGSDVNMWTKLGGTKGAENLVYTIDPEAKEVEIDGELRLIYVLTYARSEDKLTRNKSK